VRVDLDVVGQPCGDQGRRGPCAPSRPPADRLHRELLPDRSVGVDAVTEKSASQLGRVPVGFDQDLDLSTYAATVERNGS
jgi:hypothetical protein